MRLFFALGLLFFFSLPAWAQPVNDDCDGLIDLGEAPACPDDVFTNVDATASDIGFGNVPLCFNGGATQNDVWFAFTTSDTLVDVTISLFASANGDNDPILNPQIAVYRGDCSFDGLAELACLSAGNGESSLVLDLLGLTPNTAYFIRVNDYSASATPNWGDFTLCVEEYVPAINIGDAEETTACFGTLYDSGGPDEDYQNNEDLTFTICPNEPGCIEIEVLNLELDDGDALTFHAGENTAAPVIAGLTGFSSGEPFSIQTSSECVTVNFSSDFGVVQAGFELTWAACGPLTCESSLDNPTVIGSLPFFSSDESTCDFPASFAETACLQDAFLNGPESVFTYESPGGLCAEVQVSGAAPGTGVVVLDGPPTDPSSVCVAQSPVGLIGAANFQDPGTYYIVVANGSGCTDFTLAIEEVECALSPALVDALCNPLNGCIEEGGVPSVFLFEDGFQDMEITAGVNDGCWLGVGIEPDFYWFTIESQADGPFGFILESADVPSDIDFSVWGPFEQTDVCDTPNEVIDFIANNQPLRSSWAAGADPTGLADTNPVTNLPVTDEYDCGNVPGAGGDDFVSTIATTQGEVYVVLVNDWGNQIGDAGISVDWAPSEPEVLAPVPIVVTGSDTAICAGESVQLFLESGINSVEWIDETGTLSCSNCFDPVATPDETTTYKAIVDAVCYTDTVDVEVTVFKVDAGPDVEVCGGQGVTITAGSNYENATYNWAAPPEVTLSCTDCPDPEVISGTPGTYELEVTLDAPTCTLTDAVSVTVLPFDAPLYEVAADQGICEGDTISIGGPGDPAPDVSYTWESLPAGFSSADPNPVVSPSETTLYRLTVEGGDCPLPVVDSVLIAVFPQPEIAVANDTFVCQSEPIVLGSTLPQPDVTYEWTGPDDIADPSDPNTLVFPQDNGLYILTASRGDCRSVDTVEVGITQIAVDINAGLPDTVLCRGAQVVLRAETSPVDLIPEWTAGDGSVAATGDTLLVEPATFTSFFATVSVPGCSQVDTFTVAVDSLPAELAISPSDTMICEGEQVLLTTPVYDPGVFPGISFAWTPLPGQQTPDTLLNMVLLPDTTRTYQRVSTNGVCIDTTTAVIQVEPTVDIIITPSDPTICFGESVQLEAAADQPLPNIQWEPTGSLSCSDCLDPVASPTDTTNYTLVAGEMGCSGAAVTVAVVQLPVLAPNPGELCLGESRQLNLDADTVSSYTWRILGDPAVVSTDPLFTVVPAESVVYELTVANPCTTIVEQVPVTVVQPATLQVAEDFTICSNESLVLTAQGSAPDTVSQSYLWEWDGNSIAGQELGIESLEATTTFRVTYDYGPGCGPIVDSVRVQVNPAPRLQFPTDTVICEDESVVLNLDPDPNFTTYEWTSPDDPGFASSEPAPEVSPAETTTYEVVATTPFCPPLEDRITVVLVEDPTLTISRDTIICPGDPVTLRAEADAGAGVPEVFIWTVGIDTVGTTATLEAPAIDSLTIFDLTYIYGDGCGTVTRSVLVDLDEPIAIDSIQVIPEEYDSTRVIPAGELYELFTTYQPPDAVVTTEWTWDGEGDPPGVGPQPTPVFPLPGQYLYIFTVTTPAGCEYEETIDIEIVPALAELPNAFTPNGDNVNDTFAPVTFGGFDITEFKIYNRWGHLVFDNEDPSGWDGFYNGEPAPSDVYMYFIVLESPGLPEPIKRQGEIVLLR